MFFTAQGGYLAVSQDKSSKNDVYPTGTSFGGGIGFREQFYEFEAVFFQAKAEAEINHDNSKNKIIHDQASLLLNLNFYITQRLYARMGYGLHKVDQTLDKKVSPASEAGAKAAYGLSSNDLEDGINLGAGFVFLKARDFSLFIQTERGGLTSESSFWNSSLGVRIYL